jgi:hypothetical protein
MGQMRNTYEILIGKPEGKRPLGRSKRRSEVDIRMAFRKEDGKMWIGCVWLRVGTGGRLL